MSDTSNVNELATALAKAQGELEHPVKKKSAGAGSFKYTYADLASVIDAVKPVFNKHGLSFTQFPTVDIEKKTVSLITMLMHTSGQNLQSTLTMGLPDTKPQSIGSVITYARRYSLSAVAGIASEEDDDAQVAQGRYQSRRGDK